jgi:hypothetical protein
MSTEAATGALAANLRIYEIDPDGIPAAIVEDARFGLSICEHMALLSGDPESDRQFWTALGETVAPLMVRLRLAKAPARADGSRAPGTSMNGILSATY